MKIIESLVIRSNDSELKEACEPNLMWHQEIKPWMVKRVLVALLELLSEEREENENITNDSF